MKVINKKLNIFLIHFDSPEVRLLNGYESALSGEINALAPLGNCLTFDMRSDDVSNLTFFINNNPANGIDMPKLNKWAGQIKEWIDERAKYTDDGCGIGYLGSRTNWNSLSDAGNFAIIDALGIAFAGIQHRMIWGWEEIGQNSTGSAVAAFYNKMTPRIKAAMPDSLVMLHNNPGEKHWRTPMNVDLICIQETSLANMAASAQDAYNLGYAVHMHEWYNPIQSGSLTAAKKKLIDDYTNTKKDIVSGYGLYIHGYDLSKPSLVNLDTQKYFSQKLSGTTPDPNPTTMNLILGTNSTITPIGQDLNGKTFAPNTNQYIWLSGAPGEISGPIDFYLNGAKVGNTENQYPFTILGDTLGNAHPIKFPAGIHKIEARRGTQVLATATFTVGTGTPTPILGCTNPQATNYNPNATQDDGSCIFDTDTPRVDITITKTAGVDVYVNEVKI